MRDDPYVQHRELFSPQTLEDDIGTFDYPGPLYKFSDAEGGIRMPPVAFGQDNDYVYRDLLSLGDDEYEKLVDQGHIATKFSDKVP